MFQFGGCWGVIHQRPGPRDEDCAVAVLPAHHIRRFPVRSQDFEHLTEAACITDMLAMDCDVITDCRFHFFSLFEHLPPSGGPSLQPIDQLT